MLVESSRESSKHPKMPVDYSGTWDIVSNVNFEEYMIALGKCHCILINYSIVFTYILNHDKREISGLFFINNQECYMSGKSKF